MNAVECLVLLETKYILEGRLRVDVGTLAAGHNLYDEGRVD